MSSPNFIFLNGQAARVTSLKPDAETGGFVLVVIARGGADRDQLLDLLNADTLLVRLDQEPESTMRTADVEVRTVGEGPQAIHRVQATLVPADTSLPIPTTAPSPTPATDSASPLEQKLDRIIELLTEIRDRI